MSGKIRTNDMRKIPRKYHREILIKAHKVCYNWWFDILKGIRREKIDGIDFYETLEYLKLSRNVIPTCIYRDMSFCEEKDYYEFGFHTLDSPSYFLWIQTSIEDGKNILEDYIDD